MSQRAETYRGAAAPWECDVTEHFTLAFYGDRVAMAEASFAEALGLLDALKHGDFVRHYDVSLARELRAGSAFHIDSRVLDGGDHLRIGHRVVDSVEGTTATWFDAHWEGVAPPASTGEPGAGWDGPVFVPRPEPKDLGRMIPSMAGRVQPGDLDAFGRMGLCGMLHKFSDAAVQFGAAFGLTADYIRTARRSFSAFELRLRLVRPPRLGEAYRV